MRLDLRITDVVGEPVLTVGGTTGVVLPGDMMVVSLSPWSALSTTGAFQMFSRVDAVVPGARAVREIAFTLKAALVAPRAGLEEAATAEAPVAPVEITPVETFLESLDARGVDLTEASEKAVAVAMAEAIAHGTPLEVAVLLPPVAPAAVPTTIRVLTHNRAWVGPVDEAVKGWTLPGPDSASPTIFSAVLYTGPAAVEYPAVAVRTEQEAPIPGVANFVVANPAEVGRLGQNLVSLAAAAHERLAGQTVPASAAVLRVTDKNGDEHLAALL